MRCDDALAIAIASCTAGGTLTMGVGVNDGSTLAGSTVMGIPGSGVTDDAVYASVVVVAAPAPMPAVDSPGMLEPERPSAMRS